MSGNLKGDQDVDYDEQSVPENLDEFLKYLNVTCGRTRANTEPDLGGGGQEDNQSVVSAPVLDLEELPELAPSFRRKYQNYDVGALAAGLKNKGFKTEWLPSDHHAIPEIKAIKAHQLSKETLICFQKLCSIISKVAKDLFDRCTAKQKKAGPLPRQTRRHSVGRRQTAAGLQGGLEKSL